MHNNAAFSRKCRNWKQRVSSLAILFLIFALIPTIFAENASAQVAYSISGQIMDHTEYLVPGVTVQLRNSSGVVIQTVLTDNDGRYTFTNVSGGTSYTITPSHPNYTFNPTTRTINNLDRNYLVENFAAAGHGYIFGTIRNRNNAPIWRVNVTVFRQNPFYSRIFTTGGGGLYISTTLSPGFSYSVTPSRAGYTFAPTSRLVTNPTGPVQADFTARAYNIIADFDGEGTTNYSVFRSSDTHWYIEIQTGQSGTQATPFGLATDKLTPGDYDGDGITDISVWRGSNGAFYVLQSSNNTITGIQWGASGDIPVARDYDGDDKVDYAVYRPTDKYWYILQSSNNQMRSVIVDQNGGKPVPADYDGDAIADAATWNPVNGVWSVLQSTNNQTISTQLGQQGDQPVQGDYDGDGKLDFGVFRMISGSGYWFIRSSRDQSQITIQFGAASDRPVPGDYNADGNTDVAVFRSINGLGYWFIYDPAYGGFSSKQFGLGSDLPVPAAYLPE